MTRSVHSSLRRTRVADLARRWRRARRLRAAGRGRVSGGFESQLVWLVGSPRSGSTWLMKLLANYEGVVPIDEPLIGQYLGPFLSDVPEVNPGDVGLEEVTLLRKRQEESSDHFFAREHADVWRPLLRQMILGRFYAHAESNRRVPMSQAIVLIKEPTGSQSIDLILETLPASRLLFLLRDGRDVVDSTLAGFSKGSWLSEWLLRGRGIEEQDRLGLAIQSAHNWLWRTEVVEAAFAAHPGPKHRLRYEDLLANPAIELRRVLEWLGVTSDDDELKASIERHAIGNLPAGARGPLSFTRAAQPGLWRENLSRKEQEALEKILGPKLRELGYESG